MCVCVRVTSSQRPDHSYATCGHHPSPESGRSPGPLVAQGVCGGVWRGVRGRDGKHVCSQCLTFFLTCHRTMLQATLHKHPCMLCCALTPCLQGGGAGKSHMDIFQMMQEVNGLNTVNEEEEGVATPKERRKELQRPPVEAPTREDRGAARERRKEAPAALGEPKPRSRLKSDSHVPRSTFQGGALSVPKDPKKMARSLHSTSELPSKSGRRSSSDSSQPPRMRQSSSYSSLKEKK